MTDDILANFACLDELIQVIYQSIHRFVVLSSISNTQWIIHVGLAEQEGRWWHGSWTARDILEIVGSKPSDKLLETFAEKLAETIIQGDLSIQNWSPDKEPKSNSTEAAAYATASFLMQIGLQARARKCRLHASANTMALTTGLSSHPIPESGTTMERCRFLH
ncbi:hypothetical protein BD779DRAFT_1504091 [Infundibulicybe gibba]|nr:hypothetical protein BD779DRAFT_1504091 [Infundibulicybe gibba]